MSPADGPSGAGRARGACVLSGWLKVVPGFGEVGTGLSRGRAHVHFHASFTIGMFEHETSVWCRGAWMKVRPGELVVMEPYEVHQGSDTEFPGLQTMISPSMAFVEGLPASGQHSCFEHPVLCDPVLADRLKRAVHALQTSDGGDLPRLVAALFGAYGRPARDRQDPVRDVALHELEPALVSQPIAATAGQAGKSRAHFSRIFRRATGLSPLDYRRQSRVAVARSAITDGASLASAAAIAGFADQAHMTREMRSILGVSPGALKPRA